MCSPAVARGRRFPARAAAALALGLTALLASAAGAAPAVLPPKPDRYVTDRAGVLDPARAEQLNSRLEQFEKDTSIQMLVWIDRKIPENTTLEEFAVNAFKLWGVGQAKLNNGLVLFAFIDDRKLR
ncbi:MAG: TPM domain-containing protein, partial [Acidobacteriota bacterium]|nr:TPM domain-containing protein [Acidobacteriota bacterium]